MAEDNPYVQGPPAPRPSPSAFRRLYGSLYAGMPVDQRFSGVRGTGATDSQHFGDVDTQKNPLWGGKLEYRPESWKAGPVEGGVNVDIGNQRPNITPQKGITRGFPHNMWVGSLNLTGRLPNDVVTPYVEAGPAAVWSQQCDYDALGCSPPATDLGVHAAGGLERDIGDGWSGFVQGDYLATPLKPYDSQGVFQGAFNNLGVKLGLTKRFGK